jgi:hypothetical protein
LWHFQTGAVIAAAPMSYSVGGTQFVALAAGNTLYSFALPEQRGGTPKISSDGAGDGVARAVDKDALLIDAIDVDGGAATLYITPEHQSLLIDTGWPAGVGAKDPDSAQRIIAAARRHGLSKLDYVLVTHYHVDHVGGIADLLSQFPVGTILDHGPNRETPPPNANPAGAAFQPATLYPKYLEAIRGHKHRELKAGDTLKIGSLRMTVVTSDGATVKRPLPGAGGTITECETMKPLAENGGEENARSVGVVLTFGRSLVSSSANGLSPRHDRWRRANLNTRFAVRQIPEIVHSARPAARSSRTRRAASVTSIASMRRFPQRGRRWCLMAPA